MGERERERAASQKVSPRLDSVSYLLWIVIHSFFRLNQPAMDAVLEFQPWILSSFLLPPLHWLMPLAVLDLWTSTTLLLTLESILPPDQIKKHDDGHDDNVQSIISKTDHAAEAIQQQQQWPPPQPSEEPTDNKQKHKLSSSPPDSFFLSSRLQLKHNRSNNWLLFFNGPEIAATSSS